MLTARNDEGHSAVDNNFEISIEIMINSCFSTFFIRISCQAFGLRGHLQGTRAKLQRSKDYM